MSYKITGTVTQITQPQAITEKFTRSLLWVKTDEQYPQEVEVQFVQNNADMVANTSVGKVVEITFSINGRRNTGKDNVERIFNTLTGFQLKNL